jgi:SulP family sulfate permease
VSGTIAGLLVGVAAIVTSVSVAALIFSGELAPYLGYGIGMVLTSAALIGLIVALSGSRSGAIAIPQDRVAPIFAIIAASVAATTTEHSSPDELLAKLVVIFVITTLLTGAFLLALGMARAGGLMRFVPYSVVGGFFAGTGWLLMVGGLTVMTGLDLSSLAEAAQLIEVETLPYWLPGLALAVLIAIASRFLSYTIILPVLLCAGAGLFFVVAFQSGETVGSLQAAGWLLGPLTSTSNGPGVNSVFMLLTSTNWSVVIEQWSNIGTILMITALSILLTVSALEVLSGEDIDINRELRVAGVANLAAGLAGGMVGFHSLSLTGLRLKLSTQPRIPGVVAALMCGAALLFGTAVIEYLPRLVVGALLIFFGLWFIGKSLIDTWGKLPLNEYVVILLILVVIATVGFVEGFFTGLLAALVLFVLNYSRTEVVRFSLSGADIHSAVERNLDDDRLLREHGEEIAVLKLRGHLFFGTAAKLLGLIRSRAERGDMATLRFAVIDFDHVTGIDSSASYAFRRMHQMAIQKGFVLVLTGLNEQLAEQLSNDDQAPAEHLRLFVDLDHGLEWCENRVLDHLGAGRSRESQTLFQRVADHFDDRTLGDFRSYFAEVRFPAGHELLRQGDPGGDLYFLEQGEVSVYLTSKGGQTARIRRTGAGTIIGELGFYLGTPRSASVTADCPGMAYRLTAASLERMERERPDFAAVLHRFIANLLADRLLNNTHTLEILLE